MRNWFLILTCLTFPGVCRGRVITVKSAHGAKDTMNRLESAVKQKGLNVLARIDHAAGAVKIGKKLRPTELLIFGNPLPLKALVWQDESGQVWLGYNDPAYLAVRHGVAQCPAVEGLKKALAAFAQQAISKQTGRRLWN